MRSLGPNQPHDQQPGRSPRITTQETVLGKRHIGYSPSTVALFWHESHTKTASLARFLLKRFDRLRFSEGNVAFFLPRGPLQNRADLPLLERIDEQGGGLAAIESGFIQREIQESAYRAQEAIDSGNSTVVGVNKYSTDEPTPIEVFRIDPALETAQVEKIRAMRAARDETRWRDTLDRIEQAARGHANLVPPIITAVEAHATVGEVADTLRSVFGEHQERN